MIDHELRREKDGSLEDGEMSLRRKIWCGGAWYVAKEQVDIRELEEPHCLSAASMPEKKECQGTKFCLIGRYLKTLDILISYSQLIRLHRNGLSLLNFTRFHRTRFSLGFNGRCQEEGVREVVYNVPNCCRGGS